MSKTNFIKQPFLIIATIIILLGFTTKSTAQVTITGTTAGAVILIPIAVTQISPLHFGVMAVLETTPGTCVLSTGGIRIATDGVNLSLQTPFPTNAAYNIAGHAGTNYTITLPSAITVTETAGGVATMTIDALHSHPASTDSDGLIGTLNNSGTDSFTVGGTLTVPAAQRAGTYTGTFEVTIAYN